MYSFSYLYERYSSAYSVPGVDVITGDLVVIKVGKRPLLSWSTLAGETVNT